MRYLTVIRVALFALTLAVWRWLLDASLPPALDVVCIVGTMLLVFPTVRAGRRLLVYATPGLGMLTVADLAVRGLGAPFSIALSRRLTTDWLYGWTRNPMVLATFALLMSLGLRLQSALFILWTLVLVVPAWVAFLRVYEERELEIRFGDAYRTRTAFVHVLPAASRA